MMGRPMTIKIIMLEADIQGMESRGAEVFLATEHLKFAARRQKNLVL